MKHCVHGGIGRQSSDATIACHLVFPSDCHLFLSIGAPPPQMNTRTQVMSKARVAYDMGLLNGKEVRPFTQSYTC